MPYRSATLSESLLFIHPCQHLHWLGNISQPYVDESVAGGYRALPYIFQCRELSRLYCHLQLGPEQMAILSRRDLQSGSPVMPAVKNALADHRLQLALDMPAQDEACRAKGLVMH